MERMRKYSPKVIQVRLSPVIEAKLEELCKETQRPISYFMRKAIEEFLEEESLYRLAIERLQNKDDSIISAKEMHEKLGI